MFSCLHFSHFRHPALALDGSCCNEMGTEVCMYTVFSVAANYLNKRRGCGCLWKEISVGGR
jgi:hypothetical protein